MRMSMILAMAGTLAPSVAVACPDWDTGCVIFDDGDDDWWNTAAMVTNNGTQYFIGEWTAPQVSDGNLMELWYRRHIGHPDTYGCSATGAAPESGLMLLVLTAITGVYASADAVRRFAERELKLKLFVAPPPDPEDGEEDDLAAPTEAPTEVVEIVDALVEHDDDDVDEDPDSEPTDSIPTITPVEPGERRTQTVRRTLRSGSVVRFDGDLLVFGDVNPGAHVIATGNIVVLGALHGVAHAGAGGDESAFILGLSFHPTQLRVARAIALPPERPSSRVFAPEIAVLRDGAIVIRQYKGRLPT